MSIAVSSPSRRASSSTGWRSWARGGSGLAFLLGLLAPPAGGITVTTMIVAIVSVVVATLQIRASKIASFSTRARRPRTLTPSVATRQPRKMLNVRRVNLPLARTCALGCFPRVGHGRGRLRMHSPSRRQALDR
jgi:hypothetical protein